MTDLVYGRAAPVYRQHGWQGPLPLPEGAKAHPPAGYTGATGIWPTDAQIVEWCEQLPCGNIALRLPEGVIGIDIDAYLDKQGDVSLLALEATLGTLPATWRSTSREVLRKSGIYLYRVPPGRYHDKPAPNIEVIQHHHRYVVVMPSIHPEGRPYLWYDADGVEQRRPPHVEELAVLPEAWVEHLREKPRTEGQREHRHHAVDDWTPAVTKAFTRATLEMGGGRHDATLTAVMALARLDRLEHPGATAAMGELGQRFRAAISDRSTPGQADREWGDMVAGAYEIADSTPATSPKWEAWKPGASAYGPDWQWWEDKPTEDDDAEDYVSPLRRRLINAADVLDLPPPRPIIDGHIFADTLALMYGQPKAGKSFLSLALALSVASGKPWLGRTPEITGTVIYIVGEGVGGLSLREKAWLETHPESDISNLWFINGAAVITDDRVLADMAGIVAEKQPVLVVIDTLARCAPGAEESTPTMNQMIAACDVLRDICRATVLLVHHDGKDPAKGARGPLALVAAVDTSMKLSAVDNSVTLRCEAQRDAEPFKPIHCRLEVVGGSAVHVLADLAENAAITDIGAKALGTLRECDDGTGLTATSWFEASEMAKRTFYRAKKLLLDGGFVRSDGKVRGTRYFYVEGQENDPSDE